MKNILKLTERLRQRIWQRRAYRAAMYRYLAKKPVEFHSADRARPTRDEFYGQRRR